MKRFLCLLTVVALLFAGCAPQTAQTEPTIPETRETEQATTQTEPQATTQPPAEPDPVETLLSSMTLAEKVGQLFLARCPEVNGAEDVAAYYLGGYILFERDFADKTPQEVLEMVSSFQQKAAIPLLIGVDEEGGTVVRASAQPLLGAEPFQASRQIFARSGMDGILQDTREKDALLSTLGINVNFAPLVDVSTNPEDFIYDRAIGLDGSGTADYASLVVRQMALDNMGSVLKHFPGYGSNKDTHYGIAVDERPLADFLAEDLLPFAAFEAGEGKTAIMVSHNIMCCMDPELPASLSPKVHDFLRARLCFDGVVMTDALDMGAVQDYAQNGDIAVTALLAGNDILLICDYETGIPAVLEAVEDGVITEDRIDEACRRVLGWKQALGLI